MFLLTSEKYSCKSRYKLFPVCEAYQVAQHLRLRPFHLRVR
jgi:hypothetical protein